MARNYTISRLRRKASIAQEGRCLYCGVEMWQPYSEKLTAYGRRTGVRFKKVHLLQCTADHYIPKSLGGKNGDNIVAACLHCNRRKGEMHPDDFVALLSREE